MNNVPPITFEILKQKDVSSKIVEVKPDCTHRMVEMAWQDRIPFEAIETEFHLSENQLKNIMRKLISPYAYKRWRRRVQGRRTKHSKASDEKHTIYFKTKTLSLFKTS